jgi:hypothetical protein
MKFKILCLLFLALNMQKVKAQKDTVYYLLDTAALPIKDRMFRTEDEGPFRTYVLECRCYPYSMGIPFYFNIYRKREKTIDKKKFLQIKTLSISELIDIALKCLEPSIWLKYKFIFIEPHGDDMKLIDITLGAPHDPRIVTSTTPVSTHQ